MSSQFPAQYDNLPDNRVLGGPDPANDNNAQADAVNATQAALGITSSGNQGSVQSRLAALQASVAALGSGGTVSTAPATPNNYWGFDDGKTEGWVAINSASAANDSTYSHSPGDSLKISVSSATGGASFTQTVATGQNWLHRVWVHGDATSAGHFVQAFITDVAGTYTQLSVPVKLSSTSWSEIWCLVPSTGTSVTIGVQGFDLTTGMNFWIDDASLSVAASPVMTTNGATVLKNGIPTHWTGVGYYNTPIGFDNFTFAGPWLEPKQLRYDFQDIAAANLNAIRIYAGTSFSQVQIGAMLDEALRNGIDVWVGYYSPTLDYSVSTGSANRTAQQTAFTNIVSTFKYHPAVVGYFFGNEMNYNYGTNTTDAVWYPYLNTVLAAGKALAPNQFMSTANGQIAAIQTYDAAMTSLDVWGANMYQGTSMTGVEDHLRIWTTKPFVFTEYGNDSYDTSVSATNEPGQAVMVTNLMKDIDVIPNVCGSFQFEWCDEWWKGGNDSVQQTNGFGPDYNDPFDNYSNEAYYGMSYAVAAGNAASRGKKKLYGSVLAYREYMVQNGGANQLNEVSQNQTGREDGFLTKDNYGNSWRFAPNPRYASSTGYTGPLLMTPYFSFQPESAVSPILQMDGTSMTHAAGTVSNWLDKSGVLQGTTQLHPSFLQFNPSNQPTFNSAVLNGLNTLSLTGSTFMEMNNFPLGNNVTVFLVCANQRPSLGTQVVDPVICTRQSGQYYPGMALATYNGYASTSIRYFTADSSNATGTTALYVNGSTAVGAALTKGTFYVMACSVQGLPAYNYVRLGQYTEFATPYSAISDLAEIRVYQGAMTSGQVATVTAALRAKYSI